MGIFRKIEDFVDETARMVDTVYIPPTTNVSEVDMPEEWKQVTSESLRKKMGLKVGKRAVDRVYAGGYEGEVEQLFD